LKSSVRCCRPRRHSRLASSFPSGGYGHEARGRSYLATAHSCPTGRPQAHSARCQEVSLEDAQESARLTTLAMLSSLRQELGDLDRITSWLGVNGLISADAGYPQTTAVINPCSELILDLYGSEVGAHARTAIGVSALPLNLPVVISAEVEISET
jgi:YjgF/chorismate_mutase-like, putative endoribonuclease